MATKDANLVMFLCPFELNRLTGTPIRARTTILSVGERRQYRVLSFGDFNEHNKNCEVRGRFNVLRMWLRIFGELVSQKPGIIHCFADPTVIVPAIFYRFLRRRCRLIFEMHGVSEYDMKAQGHSRFNVVTKTLLDKLALIFADRVIVMSYSMKNFLTSVYKIKEEKVEVIWGPVVLGEFIKPEPHDRFTVGYAGNDSMWQGIETLLAAASKITAARNDVKFIFIGLSPEKYKDYANENMLFPGQISHEKVTEILNKCDILLSTRIGQPVADLQYPHKLSGYLAIGRPVVVTDVSDQRMIVEKEKCGIVIRPDDVEELSKAILRLRNSDKDTLLKMGRNARRFAEENLSPQKLWERLEKIYG